MLDLKAQLGDYLDHVVQRIEVDDIVEDRFGPGPVRPIQPRVPSRQTPGWVYAVAAAVVVLLLVGGVALLLQTPGSNTPVATTSPADPTPTTIVEPADPTSTTLVEEAVTGSTWSRVADGPAALGTGRMNGVTVGGPGLVAVGSSVWTSVDGIVWSRVPDDDAIFADAQMNSVTVGGPGLVAVGLVWSGPDEDAAVWTSVDGIVWSRVLDDDAIFADAQMDSVTVGGPGLVAAGSVANDAAVWTSVDGITWTRVPHDQDTFGGTPDDGPEMFDVTVGGPGLVAVGLDWSGPDADAAVWTSVDGLIWTRVPHDEEVFGGIGHQVIWSVTVAGPGLVAVGVERSARMQGVVWTSVDGLTWTRVARDESGTLDRGEMKSVAVGDSGMVAVGWIGWIGGPNSDAAVWTSVDGIAWSRVPHDDDAIGNGVMWGLINTDRGLVAVGSDGTDAIVWAETTES